MGHAASTTSTLVGMPHNESIKRAPSPTTSDLSHRLVVSIGVLGLSDMAMISPII